MRHFLNVIDLSKDELTLLLQQSARLKAARLRGLPTPSLMGKVVALVFEKPSLRTRASFEAGVAQLGGTSLFFPAAEIGLGVRETLADFSRTMSRYVDAMVFRVFKHSTLDGIADFIQNLLEEIQENLFQTAKKRRDDLMTRVESWDEFTKTLDEKGGFISAHWDGTPETEDKIKELTKATIRCIPLDSVAETGKCVLTGNPSNQRVLFAKSY